MNTLENRRKYNNSILGRLQTCRTGQMRRNGLGYLTKQDDLCESDIWELLEAQDNTCPCCGTQFYTQLEFHIAHIKSPLNGGLLTKSNIQLLCETCNLVQRNVEIDFNKNFKNTRMCFFDWVWNMRNEGKLTPEQKKSYRAFLNRKWC